MIREPDNEYRELLTRQWVVRREGFAEEWTRRGRGGETVARLPPWQQLRRTLFDYVLRDVEREGFMDLDPAMARARLTGLINDWLADSSMQTLPEADRRQIEVSLLAELTGAGPLQPLLDDPTISDILVNGPDDIWVDRFGCLEKTTTRFDDQAHIMRILGRIIALQGRHIEEATPFVDTRLPDGSRLHATLPPLSTTGPIIAIRRARNIPFRMEHLEAGGTLNSAMSRFLQLAVRCGLNILISGGAAAGKTTLLNVLSRFIPPEERLVSIEETAELHLDHPHVISLEARMPNIDGRGEVTLRTLVRNALRMRADRIIVGEVRGPEVIDMLQAMNLGHRGSLTTVHANTGMDALRRLETLVLTGGFDVPARALRDMVGSAIQLVVHMVRLSDGKRRIAGIYEVELVEGNVAVHELFHFFWSRDGTDGHLSTRHEATGRQPQFLPLLVAHDPEADRLFVSGGETP